MLTKKIENKMIVRKSQFTKGYYVIEANGKKKIIAGATAASILTSSFAGVHAMGDKEVIKETAIAQSATTDLEALFEPAFQLKDVEEVLQLNHVKPKSVDDSTNNINTAEVNQNATAAKGNNVTMNDAAKGVLSETDIKKAEKSPVLDGINLIHPIEAKKLVQTNPIALTAKNVSIENFSNDNMYAASASELVRSAEAEIVKAINTKFTGLKGYSELALAVAQKESAGNKEDIFQASQSLGKPMNSISRTESIDAGLTKLEKAVEYFKKHPEYDARYLFPAYNGGDGVYKGIENVNGVFKIKHIQEMYDRFYKEGKARGEIFYQDVTPVEWLQVKFGDYTYVPVLMEQCAFEEEISTEPIAEGTYIKDAVVDGKEVKVNVNGKEINIADVNLAGVDAKNANILLDQLKESGGYADTRNVMLIALLEKLENKEMNEYLSKEIKGKYLDILVQYKDAIANPSENQELVEEFNNVLSESDVENFTITTVDGEVYSTTAVGQSKVPDDSGVSDYDRRILAIAQAKEQAAMIKAAPEKYKNISIQLNSFLKAKKGKRIIVDIGHALKAGKQSSADPGAANMVTGKKSEAQLNMDMVMLFIEKAKALGFTVVTINPLSGEHDYQKGSRGDRAVELDGDVFISFHHNSIGNAQRSEVIVSNSSKTSEASKKFAAKIHQVQVEVLPDLPNVKDGGVKGGVATMLKNFEEGDNKDTPAFIVEPLPISNMLGSVIADQPAVVESLVNGYLNVLLEEFGEPKEETSTKKQEKDSKEKAPVAEEQEEVKPKVDEAPVVEEQEEVEPKVDEAPVVEEQEEVETEVKEVESTEIKEQKEEVEDDFSEEEKGNLRNFFNNLKLKVK